MRIKSGQVWVLKPSPDDGSEAGEPVMVDDFVDGYVDYFFFRRGNSNEFGEVVPQKEFVKDFEFFAADMGYGKFKTWCTTGKKPKGV